MTYERLEKKPTIFTRTLDAYQSHKELSALDPYRKESQSGAEQFWEQRKHEITQGLRERYILSDYPEIEIIVPVYHNASDLPLLLLGLSRQNLQKRENVQLTFIMHNNTAKPEIDRNRDGSWDQLEYMQRSGVQLRILTLDNPLLTGPYMSWQYGMLQSNGAITAVLDADSMTPETWVERITAPLVDQATAIFSGGVRTLYGTERKIESLSRAYYLATTLKSVLAPPGPNLAKNNRFAGGQAAYRTEIVRPLIQAWRGTPQGDGVLAREVLKKYGDTAFAFSDAPVLNRADSHRTSHNMWHKIGLTARTVVPESLHRMLPQPPDAIQAEIETLKRYTPWSRMLIAAFEQKGSLSAMQVQQLFKETAQLQHFADNRHVRHFLEKYHFVDCHTVAELLDVLFQFAQQAVTPTFDEYKPD